MFLNFKRTNQYLIILCCLDDDDAPVNKEDVIIAIDSTVPRRMRAKLLKFNENRRPAYWGTWRKTSQSVGPRRPFGKDVMLYFILFFLSSFDRFFVSDVFSYLVRLFLITKLTLMTSGKKKWNLENL